MWRPTELDARDGSKTEQVAALVVRHIHRGELSVGSALPSERDLARRLGVSRVTVVRALDTLRSEAMVTTSRGAGTVVAPADRLLDPVGPVALARPVPSGDVSDEPRLVDLRHGTTAAPHEVELAAELVARDRLRAAMTGDGPPAGGSQALRAAVAHYLSGQGTPTLPEQLTLTVGAGASLELVLQGLARSRRAGPGQTQGLRAALSESPTYPAAVAVMRGHGLRVRGWPAGANAWDVDQLAHLLRSTRASLVYVQVDSHNPTGQSLPAQPRPVLVDVVRAAGAVLVSDETLRPLWFGGEPQPGALSRYPGVVSIGSFSKIVWGGLRVGWVRASQQLTRVLHGLPAASFLAPSAFDELLAVEMLDSLDRVVARRCRILAGNLATLQAGLAGIEGVGWHPPTGGMTLWLDVADVDTARVATAARDVGLLVTPGSVFTPDGTDRRHLRMSFTGLPEHLARAGALLAEALASARPASARPASAQPAAARPASARPASARPPAARPASARRPG